MLFTGWRAIGASVTGSSHTLAGLPCQDANRFAVLPNDVLIAAVADGAGSVRFAERGSSLAVATAVDYLRLHLTSLEALDERACLRLLKEAATAVRNRLESAATVERFSSPGREALSSEFATTLLICFVTSVYTAAYQVGDGAIVELTSSGDILPLTMPDRGEHINETTFITSSDYAARASHIVKQSTSTDSVALLTDGIQSIALTLSDNEPFAPFFNQLFRYAKSSEANSHELAAFLASDRVCERTDDDTTLVIAAKCQRS